MATLRNRLLGIRPAAERRTLTSDDLPESMRLPASVTGRPAPSIVEALRLPDVRACVQHYAGVFALVPLRVLRETPEGPVETTGTAAEALLARPSDGMAASAWRGQLGTHLALYGEALIAKWRDGAGEVVELALLDPRSVEVKRVGRRRLFVWHDERGVRHELTTGDVIHVIGPLTVDGIRGSSPIIDAPLAFEVHRAVVEHAARTFSAGTRVQTIVGVSAGADADDRLKNLARELQARPDGVAFVRTDEVDVKSIGSSNRDSDLVAAARWASQLVARAMHVPPTAIGETAGDSMTYANAQSELQALAGVYLRPALVAAQDALSADEELFAGPLVARFALDDVPLDPARGFGGASDPRDPRAEEAPATA